LAGSKCKKRMLEFIGGGFGVYPVCKDDRAFALIVSGGRPRVWQA
jgi:hypothetical protein